MFWLNGFFFENSKKKKKPQKNQYTSTMAKLLQRYVYICQNYGLSMNSKWALECLILFCFNLLYLVLLKSRCSSDTCYEINLDTVSFYSHNVSFFYIDYFHFDVLLFFFSKLNYVPNCRHFGRKIDER